MQDLTLTFVQSSLVWEDKDANLGRFSERLEALSGKTDLVLLPEMFATGFTMNAAKCGEDENGMILDWMKVQAEKLQAAIAGTMLFKAGGEIFNRLWWVQPGIVPEFYDKRHLFRFGNEHRHFQAGSSRKIFETKGWKICPMVCYDLRFPVWARNRYQENKFEYDLLVFLANWPARRSHHWKSLLMARSIENLAIVAGVNRTGTDGNGTNHSGFSSVIHPDGSILAEAGENMENTVSCTIPADALSNYRQKFNVAPDWDEFRIL